MRIIDDSGQVLMGVIEMTGTVSSKVTFGQIESFFRSDVWMVHAQQAKELIEHGTTNLFNVAKHQFVFGNENETTDQGVGSKQDVRFVFVLL